MSLKKYDGIIPLKLIYIFIAVTLTITLAGIWFYFISKTEIKDKQYQGLKAVSNLKVDQIVKWRNERKGEALFIFRNNDFKIMVSNYFKCKDEKLLQKITDWLKPIKENHEYAEIYLCELNKKPFPLFNKINAEFCDTDKEAIKQSINSQEIVFSDFHRDDESGNIYLGVAVPLILKSFKKKELFGSLFFRIDPSVLFFPLIKSWPTLSKTAETLLIKKEGNEVVFINDLRHQKNTALNLRVSLSNQMLPAAKAILGQTGIFEGIDYRGIKVVCDLNRIPGSNWFIVSKIDEDEIYQPLWERAMWLLLIWGVLVIIAGLSVYVIWKQQQMHHFKKLFSLEQEKQALKMHFEYLVKYANDIIILYDEAFNIIEVNDRAVAVYGYSYDEFLSLRLENIRAAEANETLTDDLEKIKNLSGYLFETLHRKKDGKKFPVEISARIIKIEDRNYYQSIIRDITERKTFEQKIKKQNSVYSVLSNVNQTIVRTRNREKLFREACKIAVEDGLLRMAWIGIVDKELKTVEPASCYGYVDGFLDIIKTILNDEIEESVPTAKAVKSGKYIICNDIEKSEYMLSWRKEAIKRGYRSSVTLPMVVEGNVIGTFSLYSADKNFFDDEELKLLEELAMDLSFAIEFLNKEEKRIVVENELRESEEKYRHLFELESDALLLIDNKTGNILEVNDAACALYQYSKEELLKMRNVDLSAQADETRKATISSVTKIPVRYHRKKNGVIFPVEINASRFTWHGREVHMPAIRDITDREKTQSALQESRQMLRNILDTIPVRVFWKDMDLNYMGCNLPFALDAGFTTTEEVVGKNDFQMGWTGQAEMYRVDDRNVINTHIPKFNYEEVQTTPSGKLNWLRTSKIPLFDSKGRIKGVLGTYEDITKIRNKENR